MSVLTSGLRTGSVHGIVARVRCDRRCRARASSHRRAQFFLVPVSGHIEWFDPPRTLPFTHDDETDENFSVTRVLILLRRSRDEASAVRTPDSTLRSSACATEPGQRAACRHVSFYNIHACTHTRVHQDCVVAP